MKIYAVGGQVRDHVMGVEPKDRDYVVVGSTPEEMLDLGYEQVGASFPVFLKNGCEYALARQERKTGVGYTGFVTTFDPSITLEDDLIRRDLTMNAMAMDLDTGEIIDPYGGRRDIEAGVLRHTSEAFKEDPVRVLRTARFAARYGFSVAPDTIKLMQAVVPELEYVSQERVFAEFEKGLMEQHPYEMYEVLVSCFAYRFPAIAPYTQCTSGWVTMRDIPSTTPLYVRFAMISRGFTVSEFAQCKIPTDLSRVSKAMQDHFLTLLDLNNISPEEVVGVLTALRAFSDPDHVEKVKQCVELWLSVWFPAELDAWRARFAQCFSAAKSVDASAIAVKCVDKSQIRHHVLKARAEAVRKFLEWIYG